MIELSSVSPEVAGGAILALLGFIWAITRPWKRRKDKELRLRVIIE